MLVSDSLKIQAERLGIGVKERLEGDQVTLDLYFPHKLSAAQQQYLDELMALFPTFPPGLTIHRETRCNWEARKCW